MTEIQNPRFTFPDNIMQAFGLNKRDMIVLTRTHYPDDSMTADDILKALIVCEHAGVDWKAKPVELMPFNKKVGDDWQTTYTQVLGLNYWRMVAQRTGRYAGKKPAEYGPMVERKYPGGKQYGGGGQKADVELSVPEWAQCTVLKIVDGVDEPCEFAGARIYWDDFARKKGDGSLLPGHATRPMYTLEKTAEVHALRAAFSREDESDIELTARANTDAKRRFDIGTETHETTEQAAEATLGLNKQDDERAIAHERQEREDKKKRNAQNAPPKAEREPGSDDEDDVDSFTN